MSDKKAELKRDGTMQVTTKEGQRYLREVWKMQRPNQDPLGASTSAGELKPKLIKHTTMIQTKQEGEVFVAALGGGLDEDVKTRAQQDQLDKILDEPPAKMLKTSNEVVDKQKLIPKRISTIARTAKEGEELLKELGHKLDDNPDTGRRRTRSQTRGVPPPPLLPKKVKNTPKEVSKTGESKSRGRGRPKKSEKRDENKVVVTGSPAKGEEEPKAPAVSAIAKDGITPPIVTNMSSAQSKKDEKTTPSTDNKKPVEEGVGKKSTDEQQAENKVAEVTTATATAATTTTPTTTTPTKTITLGPQATTENPSVPPEQEK